MDNSGSIRCAPFVLVLVLVVVVVLEIRQTTENEDEDDDEDDPFSTRGLQFRIATAQTSSIMTP